MPGHVPVMNFGAGDDSSHEIKPTWMENEPDVMSLEAYKVDEAFFYGESLRSNDVVLSGYMFLEDSAKRVDLFTPYPTGEDVINAFWRTLIADNVPTATGPAPEYWRRHFMGYCMQAAVELKLEGVLRKLNQEGLCPPPADTDITSILSKHFDGSEGDHKNILLMITTEKATFPLWPMLMKNWVPGLYNVFTLGLLGRVARSEYQITNGSRYGSALKHWSYYRRFFVTRDGYFGLAPLSVEKGDSIFILRGGRVPFLLRKISETEYRIIGECYVHGIMHGEALAREGFAWERIQIR